MKHTIKVEKFNFSKWKKGTAWHIPDLPKVGETYQFMVFKQDRKPDRLAWSDDPDTLLHGIPGNSNPATRRHYGWRGTYNDVACYGVGVGTVKKIEEKEFKKTVKYHIFIDIDKSITD